jgi:hypothetical protein
MIKADAKVEYEDCDEPEKFTNFEELLIKVDVLKDQVEEMVAILRVTDLSRTKKIEAEYFDEDELYRRLEEEIVEEPKAIEGPKSKK